MRKRLVASIVLLLSIATFCNAQDKKTGIVKGKLANSTNKAAFNDLKVSIPGLNAFTTSDGDGNFEISEVPFGKQMVIISGLGAKSDTIQITVDQDVVDLKDISITPNLNAPIIESTEIPTISIADNGVSSSDQPDGGASSGEELLFSSRDPFVYAAQALGAYFFKPRGQRGQNEPEINGIPVSNARTGYFSWSQQLGNLNDVFRGRDVRYGLEPSPYTFGGINGSAYINATAADMQKEIKITYSSGEITYRNRVMLTMNTGLMKNGWAFSVSANKRWADEGYRPGTFTDAYAYFAAASKVIGKHQFNLTTFGAPLRQGRFYSATEEAYDLAGNKYYNPEWGYQTVNGKKEKRNSSVQKAFQPTTIFNYEYKPSDNTRWNTAVGYQFGTDKTSGLDGYNAASPYGNYYANLPSYYTNLFPPNPSTAAMVKQQIQANPNLLQIDWDRLYQANYANVQTLNNVNGVPGATYTGKQSAYVVGDKVDDLKKYSFNTNIEHSVNKFLTVDGGVTVAATTQHLYKQLQDLLGGNYFVNYNQFASLQYVSNPSFIQNNLRTPNQVIKTGDTYGYDFFMHNLDTKVWGQAVYARNKFDAFVAANVGQNSFYRDGLMQNGLFPNNSYGKSTTHSFLDYAGKAGITYKITGKDFLFLNAAYLLSPPTPNNTYISVNTRDFTVPDPVAQRTTTFEGGYLLKATKITARAVGYLTDVKDATEIKRFYDDDPAYKTFVNYVMQHENTRTVGTELMVDYKITRALTVTGVAAMSKSIYTNNPDVNAYLDNDTIQHANPVIAHINNYYVSNGPQSVYSLRWNYRSKNYWSANISFNYLDNNYVEINPNRRTQSAVDLVPQGSAQWHQILDQEKLPGAFTVDLHADKSFQLSRLSGLVKRTTGNNTILYISLGISNLLNNTDVIVRGSEQFRYDFTYKNAAKFPNMYQYGYGINYYLNISLKF